jgi:hypothetical protein
VFLHGVRVARSGAPHIHLLLSKEPAVHQGEQIFGLRFGLLPLLVRIGAGGDVGGDDPWADLSASLRDLFFPAPTFELLDGDGFILQVHGVFTRIRSGAALVACSGGVR